MSRRVETVLSTALTACAVVLTATYVYNQFGGQREGPATRSELPSLLPEWLEITTAGSRDGPADARVVILEFSDLECPFCRASHEMVRRLMRLHAEDIAYIFVHYPLTNHRFAMPAARAAECARHQDSFMSMVDVLFDNQDSLGLRTWSSMAFDASVADTIGFNRCMSDSTQFEAIDSGLALGSRLGVRGTPTIVINGWRYDYAPSPAEIERIALEILAGREPFRQQ